MSELDVTGTVDQFDFDHARRVRYVKHYRLVPDRLPTRTLIGLSNRIVLGHFNQIAAFSQVLSVDNMHFKLSIVANIGLWVDKLMFVSLCILQLDHDFVLLASMVYHLAHHLFLPLDQLLACVYI